MTQTLNHTPATTAVIQYDRDTYRPGGLVHPSTWTPRPDPQSPDLRVVTGEFTELSELLHHPAEEDTVWAEAARYEAEAGHAAPAGTLPAPARTRAERHRGKGRAAGLPPLWLLLVLACAAGAAGGVAVVAAAFIQAATR